MSQTTADAFDSAVTLAASLVEFFYRRGYRLRLVIGDQEVDAGSGCEHYDRLMRALALCSVTDDASVPTSLWSLAEDMDAGIYTILILPWDDARFAAIEGRASRVLRPEVVWS